MKKRIVLVMTVLLMLGNVLCVNASENLERFEKALKGTWRKINGIELGGVDHSYALDSPLELPNDDIILTEDSNGLVYIIAMNEEYKSIDTPTMGIVTLSSDNNTMVIKDTVGGFLVFSRK